ncbi:MAG: hypothetical protein K6F65_02630 [Lachnospiraceae bacterium]|nr:hypothetical protein [Lachnospiraceae bacterium]
MIYKCKNCGGDMVFEPSIGKMKCPFCDSTECEEASTGSEIKDGDVATEETAQELGYSAAGNLLCPNCGCEIELGKFTSALRCPACDSNIIVDSRMKGEYRPEFMTPFKIDEKKAKDMIRQKFASMKFAPRDLVSEARLKKIQGWYMPTWFYDMDTTLDYFATGIQEKKETKGNTEYTHIDSYDVNRVIDAKFNKLPVDAADDLPDQMMDLLAPFDTKDSMPYDSRYMSGFYSEQYNQSADQLRVRAEQQVEHFGRSMCQEEAQSGAHGRYNRTENENLKVRYNDVSTHYGLMPVWKYDYSYKDQPYPFYINGQTGKIVGTAPVDPKRVWSFAAIVGAVIIAVGILLSFLMDFSFFLPIVAGIIIGLIVGFVNMNPAAGKVTVNSATYVSPGDKQIKLSTDVYRGRETKTRQLNSN